MKMIGGPLDGTEFVEKIDSKKPYIVLECATNVDGKEKRVGLYVMYQLRDGKLYFVSTKTKQELLNL